jgi:hypothetical protein
MTAFSPSPLAQSTLFAETRELKRVAAGYRKLSSPHPTTLQPYVRQHRHSVPGITAVKDEDQQQSGIPNDSTISSTSSTSGSLKSFQQDTLSGQSSPPLSPTPPPAASFANMSPPPSNTSLKQSQSHHTNSMTTSMLNNLSLSPSTSSTSSASNHSASILPPHMQPSVSTPISPPNQRWTSLTNNNVLANEWRQNTPFPSLMGKSRLQY